MAPTIDRNKIPLLYFKEKYRRYEQTVIMMSDYDNNAVQDMSMTDMAMTEVSTFSENLLYSISQDIQDLCSMFYRATSLNNTDYIVNSLAQYDRDNHNFVQIWNTIVSKFQLNLKRLNINNIMFSSYYKEGTFSPFTVISDNIKPTWYEIYCALSQDRAINWMCINNSKNVYRHFSYQDIYMQALVEALGVFFIILLYIEYLPSASYMGQQQQQPAFLLTNSGFDFCFDSLIFEATYLHPFFINFTTPLSNDSLTGLNHLPYVLFIIKDSPNYIILQRKRNEKNQHQLISAIQSNGRFRSFLHKLPPQVRNFCPIQNLLAIYSYDDIDTKERFWAKRMINLLNSVSLNYFDVWDKQNIEELNKQQFAPEVFLNTYRRGMPLYDYAYLNDRRKFPSYILDYSRDLNQ